MQEIAENVFIETSFPGLTVGVIDAAHGPVLIDTPFRPEDIRAWRAAIQNLGGGVNRLLVNLDAHADRTLGVRAMDCTVVGHEAMSEIFRSRPMTFKAQPAGAGSEWELYEGLGSTRWAPPDITFSDELILYWDSFPIILKECPGPSIGSIWADLPEQQVLFLGDLVVRDQPPFLAMADIPSWIMSLSQLLSPQYKKYQFIVSSRGGLVSREHTERQKKFLEKVQTLLSTLAESQVGEEEVELVVPELMQFYSSSVAREDHLRNRLRWGLRHYYKRHYLQAGSEPLEE